MGNANTLNFWRKQDKMTTIQYLRYIISAKDGLYQISYETPEQDGRQEKIARNAGAEILRLPARTLIALAVSELR